MSQICNQIFSILCLSVLFFLYKGRWGSGFHPRILSKSWIPGSKKVFVNYARGNPQRSKFIIRQYCDRPVRHVIGKHACIISETKGPEFPVFKWKPTWSRQGGLEGTQIWTWGTDGLQLLKPMLSFSGHIAVEGLEHIRFDQWWVCIWMVFWYLCG